MREDDREEKEKGKKKRGNGGNREFGDIIEGRDHMEKTGSESGSERGREEIEKGKREEET